MCPGVRDAVELVEFWKHFWLSQQEKVLHASSGQRPGLSLNIRQVAGLPSQQGIIWSHTSMGPRLKNPVQDKTLLNTFLLHLPSVLLRVQLGTRQQVISSSFLSHSGSWGEHPESWFPFTSPFLRLPCNLVVRSMGFGLTQACLVLD